jgi:hypothetical protein
MLVNGTLSIEDTQMHADELNAIIAGRVPLKVAALSPEARLAAIPLLLAIETGPDTPGTIINIGFRI